MRAAAGRFANRPYGRLAGGIVSVFMPLAAVYENWIPAYAGMTVEVVGRLLSEESIMSVVTDTTNHESGSRAIRESPLREVDRGYFQSNAAVTDIPARHRAWGVRLLRVSGALLGTL